MNLTELSKQIRFDNASKGFDPTEGGVDRYLLLAISEICEAQNELRDGRSPTEIYYEEKTISDVELGMGMGIIGVERKPCGFPVEIADAIIRLLDICGKFNIEICTADFTSYRFLETTDYYLLRACNIISECQHGVFAGLQTHKFQSNLCSAIDLLIHLSSYHTIDIIKVIQEKLEFNRSRPPKHGRKF